MADNKLKKKPFISADNPVEQLKDFGVGAVREVGAVPTDIFNTALEQIGLKPQRKQPLSGEIELSSGVHKTNQEVDKKEISIDRKISQLQSVQRAEKEVFNAKQKVVEEQISKLLSELAMEVKKLETQTAELGRDVAKVTVESRPTKSGIYHLNFLDMVIVMLRDLRKRVGESRQWLALSTKKKQQKGYWQMFKKHGTTFAMSEERAIASANG